MSWSTRFRLRQYLGASLWLLPLTGALLGVGLGTLDVYIDRSVHLPRDFTYASMSASWVLASIVTAVAALTGFVVTVTVLVVQVATGTLSPRYMRVWYRDRVLKALLALLTGTLSFSFTLLRRVDPTFVPNLGTSIAGLLLVLCLVLFAIFLDRFLHRLRPVAVAAIVSDYLQDDFRSLVQTLARPDIHWTRPADDRAPVLVVRATRRGAIQAIDVDGLCRWARRRDLVVVVRHPVGDFVTVHARLIEVYGDGAVDPREADRLRRMLVLGAERTLGQDPAFAIRIMVDIAARALSSAINDPTTAVQVIDYLGDDLRTIGTVDFSRLGAAELGPAGLVIPFRSWSDYLALATTEIREYGAESTQVMRRLRAMLEDLLEEVAQERREAVRDELARLDATVVRAFSDSVDFDRARTADYQGIGGTGEHGV